VPFRPYFDLIELDRLFQSLLSSEFGTVYTARKQEAQQGVYAFFDADNPIYVGRTMKRGFGPRMQNHVTLAHNQGVLAFKRAKEKYGPSGLKRKELEREPRFRVLFQGEIDWVKQLSCKFTRIEDEKMQYVFEFYAAIRLQAPYNDFNTH
jgi:hypothetical protein